MTRYPVGPRSSQPRRVLGGWKSYLWVGLALAFVFLATWVGLAMWQGWNQRSAVRTLPAFKSLRINYFGQVTGLRLESAGDEDVDRLLRMKLPQLRTLQLTNSRISTDSVATLSSFRRLYELNFWGTPLEPAAIDHLAHMRWLRRLELTETGLSFEAFKQLELALPQTTILSQ